MGFFSIAKQKITKIMRNDFKDELEQDALKKGYEHIPIGGSIDDGSSNLGRELENSSELLKRYADYEEMDAYPEINSALDIFADDATIPDLYTNKSIWVTSDDRIISVILNDLLHNVLKIEDSIWSITRSIAHYGQETAELLITNSGVVGINILPVPTIRRIETSKGTLVGFVQNMFGLGNMSVSKFNEAIKKGENSIDNSILFEPWEFVHWRLMGKDSTDMYGTSILDSVRWVFKRLSMLEDSALVQRLQNSAKFAFYVDVGDVSPDEAIAYVNQVRQMYAKKKYLHNGVAKTDFRPNPMSQSSNYWIPSRGGNDTTRIDVVSPPDNSNIDEMEYFRDKLFSAIKVPRSYLGFGGDSNRASLSQESARFAQAEMRLQRSIKTGFNHIFRVHLASLGIDPDTVKFETKMSVPSSIFQMAQIELRNAQADNARNLSEYFDKQWVMKHVFDFSKEDAIYSINAKREETKQTIKDQYETQAEMAKKYPDLLDAGLPPLEPDSAQQESRRISKRKKLSEVTESDLRKMLEDVFNHYIEKQNNNGRRKRHVNG